MAAKTGKAVSGRLVNGVFVPNKAADRPEPPAPAIERGPAAPSRLLVKVYDQNDTLLGTITLTPKHFSSGSVGYFSVARMTLPDTAEYDAEYQCQAQMVLIGSKPEAE